MSITAAKHSAKSSPKKRVAGIIAPVDLERNGASAVTSKAAGASAAARILRPSASARRLRADAALFSRIVEAAPLAGLDAVQAIREGYSAAILKAASSYFDVPDARIQNIAQVPASTASRLQKKLARIDPAASERVYRMGTVTRMAIEVFESETAAIDWMRQPNRALASAAPLELMDTEPGAVSVRQVLNAIATGGAA